MIKRMKGFTLIELLVTILVVSLVLIIAATFTIKGLKSSEEDKNDINLLSIKDGAKTYTQEFKTEDKYWYVDKNNSNIEYACTTVERLISKGIIKKDIIGTKVVVNNQEKEVKEDTSIKIERDKKTKVYTNEVLFYQEECGEDSTTNITFEIGSPDGNNNWYKSSAKVTVIPTNPSQISSYEYKLIKGSSNATGYNVTNNGNNKIVTISENGKDIDLCVTTYTLKDQSFKYCLSEQKSKIKIDTEKPSKPTLVMNKSVMNKNYFLKSSGSNDTNGSTDTNKLTYYLETSDNIVNVTKSNSTEAEYEITNPSLFSSGKNVSTYVEDEAGNRSATVIGTLKITEAQTEEPTSNTKWYCSLHSDKTYTSEDEAKNDCSKTTNWKVKPITKYRCDHNGYEDIEYSDVYNKCIHRNPGTVTTEYYCNGSSSPSDTCEKTDDTEISGGGLLTYSCSYIYFVWQLSDTVYTNYGCPSGYTKVGFECEPPTLQGTSCPSASATTSETVKCTNYCEKTITYKADKRYYCGLGYYVSSESDCYEDVSGDVSRKNIFLCSFNNIEYEEETEASKACTENISRTPSYKTTYYCPLTKTTYDKQTQATNACKNYCSSGTYYSNYCYNFN